MTAPILEAKNIVKRFGPVTALAGVSFDLRPGEVHALCGENGAGKSTLIKTLSGVHPYGCYEGQIVVSGSEAKFSGIGDAQRAGLAVIYQELALVDEMTVAENIFLGSEPMTGWRIDWHKARAGARELLEKFGIKIDPDTQVKTLGVGQKQLVEIVKALSKNSRVLILDEPTAALSETEVEILINLLFDLRKQGVAIVYISHRLSEVRRLADRITVLRDGATVATLEGKDAQISDVIRHMVGREISEMFPRDRSAPIGDVLLDVQGLTVSDQLHGKPRLRGINLSVRQGEVVGIGGLMGAGRTELLMHLFGAWGHRLAGQVTLAGQPLENNTPGEAIARGLVLVSEDRKRYGLHLAEPIGFNLSLSSLAQFVHWLLLDQLKEAEVNQGYFEALKVKAPGQATIVGGLSGGNQQKVVLGKALMTLPQVVFLDEPTRGIDVGAKLEVYQIINRLTKAGKAVVLVSSELPELMGMSDRVLMLHDGAVGGEFTPHEYSQERLLSAAMGTPGTHATL
jgi:D-xylose transport system ATP-binding protein